MPSADHLADVFQAFVDEAATAAVPALLRPSADAVSAPKGAKATRKLQTPPRTKGPKWLQPLESRMRRLVEVRADWTLPVALAPHRGLVYKTVYLLARIALALMSAGDASPAAMAGLSAASAAALRQLALQALANLAAEPVAMTLLERALHAIHAQQAQRSAASSDERRVGNVSAGALTAASPSLAASAPPATLQDGLLRMLLLNKVESRGNGSNDGSGGLLFRLASPIDPTAARITTLLMARGPQTFSPPLCSQLALLLVDFVFAVTPSLAGRADGSKARGGTMEMLETDEAEAVAALGLLSSCVRGSPQCRQRLRGLHSRRALYRCLLSMLAPHNTPRLSAYALCVLTCLLAGDPLESRVFQEGNSEQTAFVALGGLASAVCRNNSKKSGGTGSNDPDPELLRIWALVGGDIARSTVLLPAARSCGQLEAFLMATAATVTSVGETLAQTAPGLVFASPGETAAATAGRRGSTGEFAAAAALLSDAGRDDLGDSARHMLHAATAICAEDPPSRTALAEALINGNLSGSGSGARARAANGGSEGFSGVRALLLLSLHPHHPTGAAAVALLQCLLAGDASLAIGGSYGAPTLAKPLLGEQDDVESVRARFSDAVAEYLCAETVENGSETAQEARVAQRKVAGNSRRQQSPNFLDYRDKNEAFGAYDGDVIGTDDPAPPHTLLGMIMRRIASAGRVYGVDKAYFTASSLNSEVSVSRDVPETEAEELAALTAAAIGFGANLRSRNPETAFSDDTFGREDRGANDSHIDIRSGVSASERARLPGKAETRRIGLLCTCVEGEGEASVLLGFLSAVVSANTKVAVAAAVAIPLETALGPIVGAQRLTLAEEDPLALPHAPVEVALAVCGLAAQLVHALNDVSASNSFPAAHNAETQQEEEAGLVSVTSGWEHSLRIRRFLSTAAATNGAALALGFGSAQAERKELTRRALSLGALLHSCGGTDAMLAPDALFTHAQRQAAALAAARAAAAAAAAAGQQLQLSADLAEAASAEAGLRAEAVAAAAREAAEAAEERRVKEVNAVRKELERAQDRLADLSDTLECQREEIESLQSEKAQQEAAAAEAEAEALRQRDKAASLQERLAAAKRELSAAAAARDEFERLNTARSARAEEMRGETAALRRLLAESEAIVTEMRERLRKSEEKQSEAICRSEAAFSKLVALAQAYHDLEAEASDAAAAASRELAEAAAEAAAAAAAVREERARHRETQAALVDKAREAGEAEARAAQAARETAEASAEARSARAAEAKSAELGLRQAQELAARETQVQNLRTRLEASECARQAKETEVQQREEALARQASIIAYINRLSGVNSSEGSISGPRNDDRNPAFCVTSNSGFGAASGVSAGAMERERKDFVQTDENLAAGGARWGSHHVSASEATRAAFGRMEAAAAAVASAEESKSSHLDEREHSWRYGGGGGMRESPARGLGHSRDGAKERFEADDGDRGGAAGAEGDVWQLLPLTPSQSQFD